MKHILSLSCHRILADNTFLYKLPHGTVLCNDLVIVINFDFSTSFSEHLGLPEQMLCVDCARLLGGYTVQTVYIPDVFIHSRVLYFVLL